MEKIIQFEEIQKGDTLRVEYVQDCVKHTLEGVAGFHSPYNRSWYTSDACATLVPMVSNTDDGEVTITLLKRASRASLAPVGSMVRVAYAKEWYLYIKESENAWALVYKSYTEDIKHANDRRTDRIVNVRLEDGTGAFIYPKS